MSLPVLLAGVQILKYFPLPRVLNIRKGWANVDTQALPYRFFMTLPKSKILFVVAEDWHFRTHRLPLAAALAREGHEVMLAARTSGDEAAIAAQGVRVIPLQHMDRAGLNPLRDLRLIGELMRIYRREKPDLVHHVALKPVLYGALAARLTRVPAIVNALAGLGFVFSSSSRKARLLRPLLRGLFRLLLRSRSSRLIVQNASDQAVMTGKGLLDPAQVRLIRSAGVNLSSYAPSPLPDGVPVVMLASRLLWDKGIGEFVEAARALRGEGLAARFVLTGQPDEENPSSVSRRQLEAWAAEGVVEWWGHRSDMPQVLAGTHIFCLPSYYGEGIPKVLIEAMACARPVVTTTMPGCSEAVEDGVTGLQVAPRDVPGLTAAIRRLLQDPAACTRMGEAGRRKAEAEFAEETIIEQTKAVYGELL